jgi:predicted small lipoprotein YifL
MPRLIASRSTVALMLLVALAACSAQGPCVSPTATAGSPSPTSPSPVPTQTPAADCVNPPADVTSLINVGDPVACYGSAPLALDATWSGGGVADCPSAPEPAWLACSPFSLQPLGDTRKVGAPQLFVAVDPSVSFSPAGPFPQVRVTGHFDDPAALTCRETQLGGGAATLAPAADTIESCRRVFVVTQVVPIQP